MAARLSLVSGDYSPHCGGFSCEAQALGAGFRNCVTPAPKLWLESPRDEAQ